MPNLIRGLENIYKFLFVSEDGKKSCSFITFRRKFLKDLCNSAVIQREMTIYGPSYTGYDTLLVQWKREKFLINPKL